MLRTDDAYADRANEISMLTRDISEFLTELGEILSPQSCPSTASPTTALVLCSMAE